MSKDLSPAPEDSRVNLTGGTFNAIAQATKAFSRKGDLVSPRGAGRDVTTLPVRNNSGTNLHRFDVVGIGAPIVDPATDLNEFKNKIVFDVHTVTLPEDEGAWAVLLDDLPDGDVGRAAFGGVVPVEIYGSGDYAEPENESSWLAGTDDGPARVIWRESGTGLQWGVIRFCGPLTYRVKVSENDAVPEYLGEQLNAGDYITITEEGDGGSEYLQLTSEDQRVGVSNNDAAPGNLLGKLQAGTNITLVETLDGSDESLKINSTDRKTTVSSNDSTPAGLVSKLQAGTGITLSELSDGGDESLEIAASESALVKVSSNDSTADYLSNQITGGSGVTVTETNDGSDETLEIIADGSPVMLKAKEDMTADNTSYNAVKLAADGTEGATVSVVRTNGVDVFSGEIGYLGKDDDGTQTFVDYQDIVGVSQIDELPGFLVDKVLAGDNVTITTDKPTTSEYLYVHADNDRVAVSSNDDAPDFLINQLTSAGPITLAEKNDNADESVEVGMSAPFGSQQSLDVVTDVNWDGTNNVLEQTKQTLTIDEYGRIVSISSATTTTIDSATSCP